MYFFCHYFCIKNLELSETRKIKVINGKKSVSPRVSIFYTVVFFDISTIISLERNEIAI